ncbi:MAG: HAD family hydrolase, partial [Brevinematia bacterium]
IELPLDGVLDLLTFSPKDAKDLVITYIDECLKKGITDIEIIHKVIEDNGFYGKDSVKKMFQVFERISLLFREIIEKTPQKLLLLPYAYEVSEWVYENFYTCLLTGNIKDVAYMKIGLFGLDKFFPVGAFGDEKKDRRKLVPIAINRSKEYYKVDFEDYFFVGDSHRDIIAAKENNIKSIIVLTGKMTKDKLLPYGPDFLIDDLSQLKAIVGSF